MTDIAFLGTGVMGLPMARNLAEAGFTVHAFNRTPDRAQPLAGAAPSYSTTRPRPPMAVR